MTRPVHIAVVAYHGAGELDRALASVRGEQPITVVDNSRSEAVRTVCGRRGARYVRMNENVGFAAGVNVALREILAGEPCDVLLLNPDAILPADAVAHLADALAADPLACAVSPTLVGASGERRRAAWPFPSPRQAWLEALGFARFVHGAVFAVGAVLLLRREALDEVGLFDERFFLYAEEADWQRRAYERGWHPLLCSEVVATHVGGAMSADSSHRERLFYAAQELYVRKWYGSSGWLLYRAASIVGAAIRAVLLRHGRRAAAARRLVIYVRGPCRTVPVQ